MRNTVFIQNNPRQAIGARVAKHALLRNSAAPERFDVRIIETTDFPAFGDFEGRSYLREGKQAVWRNDDLQSFTPLRFSVPELMGYQGRAVVIDPDVFALADINKLFDRDMAGAAVMARRQADVIRHRQSGRAGNMNGVTGRPVSNASVSIDALSAVTMKRSAWLSSGR
jgi:hypothetical protein